MSNTAPSVRFAPSPTGFLHLGNARTALLNWLFARKVGGTVLLRLDDTDTKRSEERFTTALREDLAWLGMTYDAFVRQSERVAYYTAAIEKLKATGRLYPCYETPDELAVKRKLQLARGLPPAYDRESLRLSEEQRQAYENEGRPAHWRFLLEEGSITWDDLIRGPIHYEARVLSDPIVVREDGTIGFLLAGAVDDMEMNISHILRGEDHITNTAIQIQIIQALKGDPSAFSFGHFSLITDAQGQGFSKRLGSLSLQDLRQEGILPLAVSSLLAALGTPDAPRLVETLEELAQHFDLHKLGRATPKLDIQDLWHLNTKFLHSLPFEKALPLLEDRNISGVTRELWEAVQESLTRLEEITLWQDICGGETIPPLEHTPDPAFLKAACDALPPEPWSQETWGAWTQAVKATTSLSGKNLYHPLREALTGLSSGPEMKKLLPLMGRARVLQRLQA